MRPTPHKLALLMSLAGLGLSLGHDVQAKSELGADSVLKPTPWRSGEMPGSGAANDQLTVRLPKGPLDASLSFGDPTVPTSEEDRAAIALAMVLMAEPPLLPAIASLPTLPITTARWEFSDAFRRDFEEVGAVPVRADEGPESVEVVARPTPVSRAIERAAPGDDPDDDMVSKVRAASTTALTPSSTVNVEVGWCPAATLDLNLDLSPSLDINLDLASVLDLNLDLSLALDLNLDLGPSVDLPLDRSPVFPVTRLKATARPAQESVARAASASEGDSGSAPRDAAIALRSLSDPREPSRTLDPIAHAPAAIQPSVQRDAAPAQAKLKHQSSDAKALPTIIVASHVDRVIHSLEALLSSDDPLASLFGAQTAEVFVASHAERALLTLAAVCRRGDAPLDVDFDQTSQEAKAAAADPTPPKGPAHANPLGDRAVAVNERSLDKVRGGFTTPAGLQMSFGIERAVYVNGALVTTTTLNFSDLGKITGGQSAVASAVAGTGNLTLFQNGPGNTFIAGPISAATAGTIVQNTLNDQKIQSITSINAAVNSLQMVRDQNFQSSLRGALIDSLRR